MTNLDLMRKMQETKDGKVTSPTLNKAVLDSSSTLII